MIAELAVALLLLCGLALAQFFLIWQLTKRLAAAQEERVKDVKLYADSTIKVQNEINGTLRDAARLVEAVEKRRGDGGAKATSTP